MPSAVPSARAKPVMLEIVIENSLGWRKDAARNLTARRRSANPAFQR
jgi:hypothetical protein